MATFDELMKQVANLQAENTNLRRELRDNSSHISKLETEACSMKDVLTHLHTAIQDADSPTNESHGEVHSFNDAETADNSILMADTAATPVLDHNSNAEHDTVLTDRWMHEKTQQLEQANTSRTITEQTAPQARTQEQENLVVNSDANLNELSSPVENHADSGVDPIKSSSALTLDVAEAGTSHGAKASRECSPTDDTEAPLVKKRSGDKDLYSHFQQLDHERKKLVEEVEQEDRERKWYVDQLQAIQRQAERLSTDQYADGGSRRQLEYERQRLLELMRNKLGTEQEMTSRHEARLSRVRMIESEMLHVQQRHKQAKTLSDEKPNFSFQDGILVASNQQLSTKKEQQTAASSASSIFIGGKHITLGTQTGDEQTDSSIVPGSDYSNQNLARLYHGGWPIERGGEGEVSGGAVLGDTASVMSFRSSNTSSTSNNQQSLATNISTVGPPSLSSISTGMGGEGGGGGVMIQQHQPYVPHTPLPQQQPQHLGTKVEMVYGLLSMLGTHDKDDMSRTLLAMSSSQDSCIAMRQSGCLPLLIQLLHGSDSENALLGKTRGSKAARARASAALHNIVHSHTDNKRGRREARVLRLLEQIRAHFDQLREGMEENAGETGSTSESRVDMDHHPGPAIAALMKLSFDEEHRHAICTLGGLQAIAELLLIDHEVNGNTTVQYNITMRRYACMALTNLTFGDGTNKALLCTMKQCMRALVAQLQSPNEDLVQVAASVLRNLSWRADLASKKILREVGTVQGLMMAAMEVEKESTLKSVLSALWNISGHCSENKADICAVSGSLAFLVSSLTYKSPTKTLSVIENGGGILKNISSYIAVREEYRQALRHHGCLHILLKHLLSPSITIVSNACGILWNLSARCPEDQRTLWEMGAVGMLKNLINSKHKMIAMGSSAAVKNLLNAKQSLGLENEKMFNSNKPGLHIRKQRALEAELDPNLTETCENMESPTDSPTHTNKRHDVRNNKLKLMYPPDSAGIYPMTYSHQGPLQTHTSHMITSSDGTSYLNHQSSLPNRPVSRSGSQDSVGSVHSDISHDRTRLMLYKTTKMLEERKNGALSPYRNNSANRSRSGSRDRSHGDHPNRIMKVMNEVAKHSGIESNGHVSHNNSTGSDVSAQLSLKESHSADNTPAVTRRSHNASFHEMPNRSRYNGKISTTNAYEFKPPVSNQGIPHVDVASLSRNVEKLQVSVKQATADINSTDERPVNYSMKFGNNSANVVSSSNQANTGFTTSYNSAFRPNVPPQMHVQVNNYVRFTPGSNNSTSLGLGKQQPRGHPPMAHLGNLPKSTSGHWQSNDVTPTAEEQPTNFSMRFAEHVDETAREDEPINYSTRFSESSDEVGPPSAKDNVAVFSNDSRSGAHPDGHFQQHISSMDDDTVKTFCTEGTPRNFLSTATSLTDLSKIEEDAKHSDEAPSKASSLPPSKNQDLDASRDETTNFSSREAEIEHATSVTESHSTERDTNSTVVDMRQAPDQKQDGSSTQKSPTSDKSSKPISQLPSLYSYNDDSSVSASPSEKPTKYCTEGTPTCFSRVSSLSSLHSSDAGHDSLQGGHLGAANKSADLTLQAIDENQSLDTSLQNQTLKDDNDSLLQHKGKSANDSGSSVNAKTVTFDQQVQETPLMFSRCSSLGSLNSFDVYSVHSSVMSEYSRRTSGIVSPSELPDSPSDTMPPSPSRRKSPPPTQPNFQNLDTTPTPNRMAPAAVRAGSNLTIHAITPSGGQRSNMKPILPPMTKAAVALVTASGRIPSLQQPQTTPENAKIYADEDLPGFSCASSLSALTIEDEPTISKERNLKRIPLGEEDGMSEKHSDKQSDKTGSQKGSPVNETVLELVEEDDNSESFSKDESTLDEDKDDFDDIDDEVSEGEENLLQQCIMIGMPTSTKKSKMHKSASDNALKNKGKIGHASNIVGQKSTVVGGIPRSATTPYHLNISLNNTPDSSSSSLLQAYASGKSRQLNQSDRPAQTMSQPTSRTGFQPRHHGHSSAVPRAQTMPMSTSTEPTFGEGFDSPKKYATEGTPLEFSRATSLSDLTIDMNDLGHEEKKDAEKPVPKDEHSRAEHDFMDDKSDNSSIFDSGDDEDLLSEAIEAAMPKSRKQLKATTVASTSSGAQPRKPVNLPTSFSSDQGQTHVRFQNQALSKGEVKRPPNLTGYGKNVEPEPVCDVVKSYAVEGTPLNFSRAESLSDLSDINSICDTKSNSGMPGPSGTAESGKIRHKSMTEPLIAPKQTDPAVLRIKSREDVIEGYGEQDTVRAYAVEDTPYNFSRRTSLSALSMPNDDEINQHDDTNDTHSQASSANNAANTTVIKRTQLKPVPVEEPTSHHNEDAVKTYAVEDTPYNFSRRTSLSGLSDVGNMEDLPSVSEGNPSNNTEQQQQPQPFSYAGAQDGIITYAVEDTPYNFSRRTSLSALSIPEDGINKHGDISDDTKGNDEEGDISVPSSGETTQNVTMFLSKPDNLPAIPTGFDSPRVYGMEGTPLNFSRNDSLSSLECDDFEDIGDRSKNASLNEPKSTPSKLGVRKSGLQSPAIKRLKTPQKFRHPPTMHSTPMPKSSGQSPAQQTQSEFNNVEKPQTYTVEDTPAIFSRNSSLSSLDSADHESMAHLSNESAESGKDLHKDAALMKATNNREKEKDCLRVDNISSHNLSHSSLSSLSVESLSFEPSESESALLEECISSAMPKSAHKIKRKESLSRLARPSPSSGSRDKAQAAQEAEAQPSAASQSAKRTGGSGQVSSKSTAASGQHADSERTRSDSTENVNNNNVIGSPTRKPKETNQVQAKKEGIHTLQDGMDTQTLAETFADLDNQFAELGMSGVSGDNTGTAVTSNVMTTSQGSSKYTYNMESSEEDSRLSQISTATKDLCVEARFMVDVIQREKEHAPSDQSTDSLEVSTGKGLEGNENAIPDIMKESFPEMTSSLISNITTPDKEIIPEMMNPSSYQEDVKNTSHGSSVGGQSGMSDSSVNITVIPSRKCDLPETIHEQELASSDKKQEDEHVTDPLNMTAEEVKALEDNANIILSCMAANQMSCSSVSDDAFIDQECISLVSSGAGDTGSEVSCSGLSITDSQARTTNRQSRGTLDSTTSESTTICRTPSATHVHDEDEESPIRRGPRISKPDPNKFVEREESPKGIRGGKKVIKGRPPPACGSRTASPSTLKSTDSKKISPRGAPAKKSIAKTPPNIKQASEITRKLSPSLREPSRASQSPVRKMSPTTAPKPRQSPVYQKGGSTPKDATSTTKGLKNPTASRIPPRVSPKPTSNIQGRISPKSLQHSSNQKPKLGSTSASGQESKTRNGSNEGLNATEVPGQITKQGTFVKDDSSYSLTSSEATTVRYRTPTGSTGGSNRNSCEISTSNRSSFDLSSNRNSMEIKYSQSANEFQSESTTSHKSRPTSKSSESEKVSPTKSEKSDHGCFTVEGYGGAWEGSSFTVCDYTGAWEDVRRRRRSGESGSGSCTDTPPIHRRSLIVDPIEGIIEDSYNNDNVFKPVEDTPTAQSARRTPPPTHLIPKPSQIAKPTSRLPQASRLPAPRSSSGSPRPGSSTSLARSSSSGSGKSFTRGSPRSSLIGKPTTPPRTSSLDQQRSSPRSSTPPNRYMSNSVRNTPLAGRPVSPLAKSSTPSKQINSTGLMRSPYGQKQSVTPRKGSADSINSVQSTAQQNKKSALAKPSPASSKPTTAQKSNVSAQPKKSNASKLTGFLRKGKTDTSKTTDKESQRPAATNMQTSLIRSGTYEKLDADNVAETDVSATEEARKAREKRAAKVKQWRKTYTITSGDESSVSGSLDDVSKHDANVANSDGGSDSGSLKSRIRRSGLFRRSKTGAKDEEEKKEKNDQPKKKFSLWRRDSSDKGDKNELSSPNDAALGENSGPDKSKRSIWRKKRPDIENDMNSPNSENPCYSQNESAFVDGKVITPTQVVQPFNYVPASKPWENTASGTSQFAGRTAQELADELAMPPPPNPTSVTSIATLSKTEMLIARRRGKQHGGSSGGSGSEVSLEGEEVKKQSFLVTTV